MYDTDYTCPYTVHSRRCVSALLGTLDDTQIDVCGGASSRIRNHLESRCNTRSLNYDLFFSMRDQTILNMKP